MMKLQKTITCCCLCTLLDDFIHSRGKMLFPEKISLIRKYHAEPSVKINRDLFVQGLNIIFSKMIEAYSPMGAITISVEEIDPEFSTTTLKLTCPGIGGPPERRTDMSQNHETCNVKTNLLDSKPLKRILREQNSTLSVSYDNTNTATVSITLPAHCSVEDEKDGGGEFLRNNACLYNDCYSVLIADDEPQIRELLGEIMNCLGVKNVDYAKNGIDAYKKAVSSDYDMIFLDMVMPMLSGREAYHKITSHKPETKIVFISGLYHNDEIAGITGTTGAFGYINKPFNIAEVKNLMERALHGEKN